MKKAIITGASNGLGKEIGLLFLKNKIKVVNLSRTKSDFKDIKIDLSSDKDISNTVNVIKKQHADFDILVLNAGIMPLAKTGEISFDIDKTFQINISSMIKLVNKLFDLIKKNHSDIVIIGSTASLKGYEEHSVYCATKHAVEGFIKSLQLEFKNDDVRVIGFHPGGFKS